ncbi:MAG: hypothetical protein ACT4ON_02855 [Bacteroidota bacterium]
MNGNNNREHEGFKGTNPFKTGVDYFENFNSKLQNSIDGFEEIKTIAPVLSSIPKYNPFEVPVNYFDELLTIVQQRCIESKSNTILEWLTLLIKPRFVIPAFATVLIAIAGIHFMNKNAVLAPTVIVEGLTIEEQLYTIDEATIIEKLTADATIETGSILENDNSIEDYLIDHDIDEANLNNEL